MKCEHINFLIYYIIPLLHKKTPILTFWRKFYKSKIQILIWIHTPSIQNYIINFDFLKVNLKMDTLNNSHSFMGSGILWVVVRNANLIFFTRDPIWGNPRRCFSKSSFSATFSWVSLKAAPDVNSTSHPPFLRG